ncbi:hypothetical protein Pan181_02900 [Aeoliella mucimassa]|uniref:Uncharacterized protein n=1 Tax=Aeoliella mucimassa TaxID=2527972 RepID=A0A518AH99_9BACT|nr:hypothetical protein Pan181_02900 [Aeoliella mucimassa]
MQLATDKRLAIDSHCENRFPLDAFWERGIYSGAKTTGFAEWARIQFSHRWENWESICPALGIYSGWWESISPGLGRLAPSRVVAEVSEVESSPKGQPKQGIPNAGSCSTDHGDACLRGRTIEIASSQVLKSSLAATHWPAYPFGKHC